MRVMGADRVEPPVDGPAVPRPGRALCWDATVEVVEPAGVRRRPGVVVVHHDDTGRLRIHRLAADPEAWGRPGDRYSLVLVSRAGDLQEAREVALPHGWVRVGTELTAVAAEPVPTPGAFLVELYAHAPA